MKRIALGKIVGAHGVKGLVKILPFGEDPMLMETLGPVFSGESGDDTLSITMKNSAGNKVWLAEVDGVSDRNAAEVLRGRILYIDAEKLPKIAEENSYYHKDLIGLTVVDENEREIGTVIGVDNFGAGDLFEIRPRQGKSFYLPFKTDFVTRVDLENKTLHVQRVDEMRID